ncbi:MAG: DVU_1553 family AMP-dependent CoA ligase [Pseudomonadota bacterium]
METVYLEQWLHKKIMRVHEADAEFRHFTGKGALPEALNRKDVELYQLYRLRKVLAYVFKKSAFYRERFKSAGLKPDDLRSLEDLSRVPFTEPMDLAEHSNRFLCVSHGDISRVTTFTTSGTTGPQKRIFCTKADLERMTDFMGTGLKTVATEKDVLQIMLPFGSVNNQGDLLTRGAEKAGIRPVKAGMHISHDAQMDLIRSNKSTVLFGPTPRIFRMSQEMNGKVDLKALGMKTLFLTSGYLSESMRDLLSRLWQCDVHSHYGLTEMGLGVAVECHAHSGYHFNEADLLLEVVDPQTGRPIEEGEGELVFTTLTREGMPLIRYRTHDLSCLITDPCPCGASGLLKFGKITRRLEDRIFLTGGDEIYFSLFDEMFYNLPDLVDYQIMVDRVDGKDHLTFSVEVIHAGEKVEENIRRGLSKVPLILKNLKKETMTDPEIAFVAPGSFHRGGRAKKMIEDHR